jgi:hypothetical protein
MFDVCQCLKFECLYSLTVSFLFEVQVSNIDKLNASVPGSLFFIDVIY